MSEPTEKQTPRTDEVCERLHIIKGLTEGGKRTSEYQLSQFTRQLETELAAAEAQAAAMRAYIYGSTHKEGCAKFNLRPKACSCGYDATLSTNAGAELLAERDRLQQERDELKRAIEQMRPIYELGIKVYNK